MENVNDVIPPSIPIPRSVLLQPYSQTPTPIGLTTRNMLPAKTTATKTGVVVKESFRIETEPRDSTHLWKVTNLLPVPMFHPLECTAIVVNDDKNNNKNISLDEICARISTFMRLNSISCSYRSDIPGHIDCLSPCLLKFSVQLWQQQQQGKNNQQTTIPKVILEVSRIQGCTVAMQHLRNQLVSAVMTGPQQQSQQHQNQETNAATSVLREMYETFIRESNAANNADNAMKSNHCKEAVCIVIKLLESNCFDQNRLGMESLSIMTNPNTLRDNDAYWVARAVVFGQGEFGAKIQSLLGKYFDTIQRPEHDNGGGRMFDDSDDNGFLEFAKGCSFGIMHNLALQVLKNSLERIVIKNRDSEKEETIDGNSTFWKTVISALVYNMQVAEHRPHEASIAARCLDLLENLGGSILDYPQQGGNRLVTVAIRAQEFGKLHHMSLERETGNLITNLRTVVQETPPSEFYWRR